MSEDNGYLKKWVDSLERSIDRNYDLINNAMKEIQYVNKKLVEVETTMKLEARARGALWGSLSGVTTAILVVLLKNLF